MSDAASLQNLNDIVVPAALSWWPPAPGWYVIGALLLILLLWQGTRSWSNWRNNRYRREALAELAEIQSGRVAANGLPELLKRTALSAWPRSQVAALSGAEWHQFLDDSATMARFSAGAGEALDRLAYAGSGEHGLSDGQLEDTLTAVETWLKRHRVEKT